MGGAQRDRTGTIKTVGRAIEQMLADLSEKDGETLRKERRQKFLDLGSKGLAA